MIGVVLVAPRRSWSARFEAAIALGALTGCIVNVAEAPLAALALHPICIPTGAEVLMDRRG